MKEQQILDILAQQKKWCRGRIYLQLNEQIELDAFITNKEMELIKDWCNSEPEIEYLYMNTNIIGDEGAKILAKTKYLKVLDLRHNVIGDEGAIALAQNTTFEMLYLASNRIGDEGAKALEDNINLKFLDLRGNYLINKMRTKASEEANKRAIVY